MKARYKLTAIERDQIALLHTQGISNSEIARRLRREVSTIGRELKRNRWGETYVAIHAQQRAWVCTLSTCSSLTPDDIVS